MAVCQVCFIFLLGPGHILLFVCLSQWCKGRGHVKTYSPLKGYVGHWHTVVSAHLVGHSLSHVQLFSMPWTVARQAPFSSTISLSLLKLMFIEPVMLSNHLILCSPLLLQPSIFPSIGVFPMSELFASRGQSIGASVSASVLPMNIQS